MTPASACWHCGEPLPANPPHAQVAGAAHAVCCNGCRAAAQWIGELGLADYYRLRSEKAQRPPEAADTVRLTEACARPELARHVTRKLDHGRCEAIVLVDGLRCAACSWLVERAAGSLTGVASVAVNASARRARIVWDGARVTLPQIVEALGRVGYRALPLDAAALDDARRGEARIAMKRLAVAGFGAMQAMMYASALYFGAIDAQDAATRDLFRWLGLMVATPVVFYAAGPFFAGARRSLAARRLGMDVPVAIAIALIYAGSVVEVIAGGSEVYFESVSMFVLFLLAGRYLEMRARHRAGDLCDALARLAPVFADRCESDGSRTRVAAIELAPGDRVQVAEGGGVPADGVLESDRCRVDEALLSGESAAVLKRRGDTLCAGSIVVEGVATIRVERVGADTLLSGIVTLVARASTERPRLAQAGERAAAGFVARVLALAAATALGWAIVDPQRAFAATVAVLVVSCPCAFALAVPAALTRALGVLARRGVLVVRADAIEQLALATHVIFDKTGTLTDPQLALDRILTFGRDDRATALALAVAMARESRHPAAQAIARAAGASPSALPAAQALHSEAGSGIEAIVGARRLRLGRADYALALCNGQASRGHAYAAAAPAGVMPMEVDGETVVPADEMKVDADAVMPVDETQIDDAAIVLADDAGVIAAFHLSERLRSGARAAVDALRGAGLEVSIVSGDAPSKVAAIAAQLGVAQSRARARPADKLAYLAALRERGARVIAIGDGINDAPVLAGADVAVAVASGAELTQAASDIVLATDNLSALADARKLARETLAVLRQNQRWALAYNLAAVPLAALGFVAPWLAALGMSVSSLVVVLNALRIGSRESLAMPALLTREKAPA